VFAVAFVLLGEETFLDRRNLDQRHGQQGGYHERENRGRRNVGRKESGKGKEAVTSEEKK